MIIGKGLLARAFEPHFGSNPNILVFASGVSNSLETRLTEFERERTLLNNYLLKDNLERIIYFGSCGITASENELTPYMQHKRAMESLVRSSLRGLVLRLPQVVGVTQNAHTLTNFLRDRILSGEHFTVWAQAERNLIDVDDIAVIGSTIAREMGKGSSVVSVAAQRSLLMPDIVRIFERTLHRAGNYSIVEKGTPLDIDTHYVATLSDRLGLDLGDGYIERVIQKYYANR